MFLKSGSPSHTFDPDPNEHCVRGVGTHRSTQNCPSNNFRGNPHFFHDHRDAEYITRGLVQYALALKMIMIYYQKDNQTHS